MTERIMYAIYGVRLRGSADWDLLHEQVGDCPNDGTVGCIRLGSPDHRYVYLVTEWEAKGAGGHVYHSGTRANASMEERGRWNTSLLDKAREVGVETSGEPGWFTILNEA